MIETSRTAYQSETVDMRPALADMETSDDTRKRGPSDKWPLWMRSWFLIFLVVSAWSLIGIVAHAILT